jgi:hypothetical protein
MEGEGKLTKCEAMMFFYKAWELMSGTPGERDLELRSHAEENGVDLDEAMGYVAEAAEKGYHAGGHTIGIRGNVLRIYRPGEPLSLSRDHVNGMATLLSIDLGRQKDR